MAFYTLQVYVFISTLDACETSKLYNCMLSLHISIMHKIGFIMIHLHTHTQYISSVSLLPSHVSLPVILFLIPANVCSAVSSLSDLVSFIRVAYVSVGDG